MALDRAERVAREYFERLPRERDLSVIDELLAPGYVDHDAPPGTPPGPEATKAFVGALLSHHPDLRIEIDDCFGSGDRAALRLRWLAPETGYRQSGIVILRVDGDGRIAERWSAYMPLS
jgi:predicted SnoaL-like aldol condensation-catalyzing enzyme